MSTPKPPRAHTTLSSPPSSSGTTNVAGTGITTPATSEFPVSKKFASVLARTGQKRPITNSGPKPITISDPKPSEHGGYEESIEDKITRGIERFDAEVKKKTSRLSIHSAKSAELLSAAAHDKFIKDMEGESKAGGW
jgi:hypothetical protein